MHVAFLGNPGSWYCAELERAAAARGHVALRVDFTTLRAQVGPAAETIAAEGLAPGEADAVVVRTMPPGSLEQVVYRMDVLARWAAAGTQVLNPPKALECAVDKFLATTRLREADLLVPETEVCEESEAALAAFERLGGDVVVKPLFGSEGRGILRVSDPDLALRAFRTLERIGAVLYVQRFVPHAGHDVRVLVLDGRVLGAIRRHAADGDFRTNVSRRGRAEVHRPTDDECEQALRAGRATGARFAGVDLLPGLDGRTYAIEVNGVPGWQAFQRATGLDVATEVIAALERGPHGIGEGEAPPRREPPVRLA